VQEATNVLRYGGRGAGEEEEEEESEEEEEEEEERWISAQVCAYVCLSV
jgi:hypothetical protein